MEQIGLAKPDWAPNPNVPEEGGGSPEVAPEGSE